MFGALKQGFRSLAILLNLCSECYRRTLNRKEQLRRRAVSLRQHGFLVFLAVYRNRSSSKLSCKQIPVFGSDPGSGTVDLDRDPDRHQNLIDWSLVLAPPKISSKSVHNLLSDLANKQTRDLRSFEIRFEFESAGRFDSIRK